MLNDFQQLCRRLPLLLPVLIVLASKTASGDSQSELEKLRGEINAAIGSATASAIEQCESIAVGVKPCGGPWEYLVFSTEVTDVQTLKDLVQQYNALDRSRNERLGIGSDCGFVDAPALVLNEDRCEVKSDDQKI